MDSGVSAPSAPAYCGGGEPAITREFGYFSGAEWASTNSGSGRSLFLFAAGGLVMRGAWGGSVASGVCIVWSLARGRSLLLSVSLFLYI